MTTPDTTLIDSTLTVREILRRYPASRPVLAAAGVDTCCAAGDPLHLAVQRSGVDLDALVAAIGAELARATTAGGCSGPSCECGGSAR